MDRIISFLLLIIIVLAIVSVLTPFPENYLSKLMPDNKLYFLKIWYEKLNIFFTFDAAKRAGKYQTFAEERAVEAKQMFGIGKFDLANKLKDIYTSYLNKAKDALNKAIQKAIDKQKEALVEQLKQQVDDIMNKIKESIKL